MFYCEVYRTYKNLYETSIASLDMASSLYLELFFFSCTVSVFLFIGSFSSATNML